MDLALNNQQTLIPIKPKPPNQPTKVSLKNSLIARSQYSTLLSGFILIGFKPFPSVLAPYEMQTASSRIYELESSYPFPTMSSSKILN